MFRPVVTEKTPRLFQNDFLEKLSRTHPSVVAIVYLPIVSALLWYSATSANVTLATALPLALTGIVAWTFTEYWLHRTIMHWIPEVSWGSRLHFWVHGVHHDLPDDPYRLVMPPAVSMGLFFIFLGLFYLTLGKYSWAFHAGFTFGYVIYDLTHYYVHHFKPKLAWAKGLQKHHLFHHFNPKYDERKFSITLPLWDKIFNTDSPIEPAPAKGSNSE